MKPTVLIFILFLFQSVLFLSLTVPTHADVLDSPSVESLTLPISAMPKTPLFAPAGNHPTVVTLARVQVTPAYPPFGMIGSLILIALILMFRVYRSI